MTSPHKTSEWLDLFRQHAPALRQRVWTVNKRGHIRTVSGQCPICALAEIVNPQAGGLSEAWSTAIRRAWGDEQGFAGAFPLAMAADNERLTRLGLRAALLTILGLRHDL